jgi:hypothetical protein
MAALPQLLLPLQSLLCSRLPSALQPTFFASVETMVQQLLRLQAAWPLTLITGSNGTTTASNNNLIAGNYTVTVTDDHGCTATTSVTITEPTLLMATISASTNVSCFGGNNGSATVTAAGGVAPYTYNWSNGTTTAVNSHLIAGTYTVTVTDDHGCTATTSVTITELTATISASTNVSCFSGNDGSATVTAAGGVAPYTYNWSNGTTTATNNNLIAGTYTVTVTDDHGCTATTLLCSRLPSALQQTTFSYRCFRWRGNDGSATVYCCTAVRGFCNLLSLQLVNVLCFARRTRLHILPATNNN